MIHSASCRRYHDVDFVESVLDGFNEFHHDIRQHGLNSKYYKNKIKNKKEKIQQKINHMLKQKENIIKGTNIEKQKEKEKKGINIKKGKNYHDCAKPSDNVRLNKKHLSDLDIGISRLESILTSYRQFDEQSKDDSRIKDNTFGVGRYIDCCPLSDDLMFQCSCEQTFVKTGGLLGEYGVDYLVKYHKAGKYETFGDINVRLLDNNFLKSKYGEFKGVGFSGIEKLISKGNLYDACVVSLLYQDYPMQVDFDQVVLNKMIDLILPKPIKLSENFDLSEFERLGVFRLKRDPLMKIKVNIWLEEVLVWLKREFNHVYVGLCALSGCMIGMTNDQVSSLCIYSVVLSQYYSNCCEIAVSMFQFPELNKLLSTFLKGIGYNRELSGGILCESDRMLGRSAHFYDMPAKVRERLKYEKDAVHTISEEALKKAIMLILHEELDIEQIEFDDVDEFWQKRWSWCTNGGHSKALERSNPMWKVQSSFGVYRRVAIENWQKNPLREWDGSVYVSASEKNEPGKRRLLLASDTVSYSCFEHLLKPIERAWRNKRVLLNPDLKGRIGVADKIRKMKGSLFVALDYDDFNAQQRIRDHKLLFECICEYVNYDIDLARRIIDSFDMARVFYNGEEVGRIKEGLCSGHRATSFINSILNPAYIIASGVEWSSFDSAHTGDDSIVKLNALSDVEIMLKKLKNSGLKLNSKKQSVGRFSGEFLRMSVSSDHAVGYVARAIASCVSGNWENPLALGLDEYITSIIGNVRSIINRSGMRVIYKVFVNTLHRRTGVGKRVCDELLSGRVALGNGPVYHNVPVYKHVDMGVIDNISAQELNKMVRDKTSGEKAYASTDYASNCVTPIELRAAELTGLDIYESLKGASYAKSLREVMSGVKSRGVKILSKYIKCKTVKGLVTDSELYKSLSKKEEKGYFSDRPLLQMIKKQLKDWMLIDLLRMDGVEVPYNNEVYKFCFGERRFGCVVNGILPYSDCAHVNRIIGDVFVVVRRPIYY